MEHYIKRIDPIWFENGLNLIEILFGFSVNEVVLVVPWFIVEYARKLTSNIPSL
jgi:hypothetical protein